MKKITLLILVFFTSITSSLAQNNTSFFNDYHKINFQFGASRYTGTETTPLPRTLNYTFNNFTSPHFGLYYDVLQTNRFNFKVGLSLLLIREIDEVFIHQSEIEDGTRDFARIIELTTDGMWRLNLPITSEYLLNTTFGKLTLNSSFVLGFHKEFGLTESEYNVAGSLTADFSTLESVYSRSTAPWYANGQVGVGMYFPFKGWMLRTYVYYNFALQNLYEGTFEFKNLQQSPDTSGNFSFKGNSFGIEFSVYLAKKKKNAQ